MGQYCFACRWRLLSVVCRRCLSWGCNAAGGPRPPGEWAVGALGASAVGQPTLHCEPVRLRPVRATPCYAHMLIGKV